MHNIVKALKSTKFYILSWLKWENSLEVQWLELQAFTAKGAGLIPGQGTKILQAAWHNKKKKKKKYNWCTVILYKLQVYNIVIHNF